MKKAPILIGVLLVFLAFLSAANAQTISYSGTVKGSANQGISGATIIQAGNPSVTTTSDGSGNFTLTGLPSGTPFSLKMAAQGFVDTYSSNMSFSSNSTGNRPYTLFTTAEYSQWNITAGKGVITGKVSDQSSPPVNVDGAVVSAASSSHPGTPYTVVYPQDSGPPSSTSTATNGKFMVLNVDDGDTVTVTATKSGWTFGQRVFITHANSISQSTVTGTQGSPPQTVSFTGSVITGGASPSAVAGATVEMTGNASLNTTSDASGNFTLPGLPSGTPFSLKISKQGFLNLFTFNWNLTQNFNGSANPYPLLTSNDVATWNITAGKGVITGKVVDQSNPQTNIDGAVVTATSQAHPGTPYTVVYPQDSGPPGTTSTATNGKYRVTNVDDGDTVTVTATKSGWTFVSRVFVTHADSVSTGLISGTSSGGGNSVSLGAGWNFFSFPKQPPETAIATVLSDILSDVKVVWGFDNNQKVWKLYKPGGQGNTLSTLEQGKGYWIYLVAAHTIDISSWTSVSSQVHLYEGWNLIGYSGTNGANIIPALSGITGWQIVWVWIGSNWKADAAGDLQIPVPPVSTFEQGRAYWIKMGTGASGDWSQ